jgi:hypothetical protein
MSNFSNKNTSNQFDRDRIDLSEAGVAEMKRVQKLKSLSRASERKILLTSPRVASEADAEFSRPLTGDLSKLFSGERGTPLPRGYLTLSMQFVAYSSSPFGSIDESHGLDSTIEFYKCETYKFLLSSVVYK